MINFSELFTLPGLVSLLTLSVLEVVLGIDNIIFIAIVATKLPKSQQARARAIGLTLALIIRIGLLFSISWIVSLVNPLFSIGSFGCSGRDLILFSGGVFLLYKTTKEILEKFKGNEEGEMKVGELTLKGAILQIVIIDIVFSFDSILTAVGLVSNVILMVGGVVIAMLIMLAFSGAVSDFINKHPTVKMLALAFLIVIGLVLCAEGLHAHIEKAYIYVALAFSMFVEYLNMKVRSNAHKRHD